MSDSFPVPEGWRLASLGRVASVGYGMGQPPGFVPVGVPFVRATDIKNGRLLKHRVLSVRNADVPKGRDVFLRSGDLVVVRSGAYTGDACRIDAVWEDAGAVCGYDLRVRPHGVQAGFLLYWLLSDYIQKRHFAYEQTRSAQPHLNASQVENTPLPLPPLPEQRKIAAILGSVDAAIEKTEALIAKLRDLKQAMMQELLTKGLSPEAAAKYGIKKSGRFKDSPIGRIPEEWEVRRIGSLLADVDAPLRSGPFGSALLKEDLVDSGVPLLGIDNVLPERFVPVYRRFVSPERARDLSRFRVHPRDVMVTIMGTVGRCCMVPDSIGEALSSKHVWTISFDEGICSPYLACLQVNHAQWVLDHFAHDQQGAVMASIRSETLRSAPLVNPPTAERELIEGLFRAVSGKVEAREACRAKLMLLKASLMQDLLTGKVRVTNIEHPTPNAQRRIGDRAEPSPRKDTV